jgi:hypothetical protein
LATTGHERLPCKENDKPRLRGAMQDSSAGASCL